MKRGWILLFLPLVLAAAGDVRPYLNTGPWYPADEAQLQRLLDGFFNELPAPEQGVAVRALVAPHAGFQYSGRCAAKAYRAISPTQGIRRVILLGSSHRSGFYGACVDDYAAWTTPLGEVAVDRDACRILARDRLFRTDRSAMRHEHSLENQLPFLQQALGNKDYRIVPILFGALNKGDFARMASAIRPLVDGRTLVVASSDLTHYGADFGYTPFRRDLAANLEKLDKGFIKPVLNLDFEDYFAYREKTGITACGFVPIGVLIRLFEKKGCRTSLAAYCRSGDLSGDYSTSVSYASLLFTEEAAAAEVPDALDRGERRLLLDLARSVLRERFQGRPVPANLEERFSHRPRLLQKSGVFVTLRKSGELRGCIGSIVGVEPLCRGVAANALNAAFADPRFPPLRERELDGVEIEISVMTPLRPAANYRAIRLGTDGVVIRDGAAQAVFLPQVASETGWTLDEFLGRLCRKAGLERDAYRNSPAMKFFTFQAQVFSEREAGQ